MERKVVNNAFYDDLGHKWYEEERHPIALLRAENRSRAPWVAQTLADHFDEKPCTVLDIGCGAGFLSNALALQGHQVTGIDLSEKSLEVGKLHDSTQTVSYQPGNATKLSFPNQQFDTVCAMDLLEHVENPSQVISEAARVLKPGGLFFFHTFNRTWLSWLLAVKGIEWFIPNAPSRIHIHRLFIKPTELTHYLHQNSLSLSHIHGLMPKIDKEFFKLLLRQGISPQFSFQPITSLNCGYVGFAQKNEN